MAWGKKKSSSSYGGGWKSWKGKGKWKKGGSSKKVTTQKQAQAAFRKSASGGPGLPGFPATNTVCMRFAGQCDLSVTGVLGDQHTYSCNSGYDPDFTSAGGFSAMGWDEWSAFYNHYMVESAKITVTFTIPASATPSPTPMCAYLKLTDDGTDDAENFEIWQTNGNTVWKPFAQGTQATVLQLTGTFNTKTFFDVVDPIDAQERLGAPMTTNPTERAFWMIGVCSTSGAAPTPPGEATSYPAFATVLIEYNITLTEPKALAH